jgi:hypothetical protein
MRKEAVYSAAASIANLALVVLGVALTTIYVPRVTGWHAWWVYGIIAVVGSVAWGYLVQWLLSVPVNTVLAWMILGRRDEAEDRR